MVSKRHPLSSDFYFGSKFHREPGLESKEAGGKLRKLSGQAPCHGEFSHQNLFSVDNHFSNNPKASGYSRGYHKRGDANSKPLRCSVVA